MPSTFTKKARLSSGLGVNISRWPRWAKSIIGSGLMCSFLLAGRLGHLPDSFWELRENSPGQGRLGHALLAAVLRFAGAAVFGRSAEHLAAVGQNNLAGVGDFIVVFGAESFDGYLIPGFQRIARPAHAGQRVRSAVFTLPMRHLALFIGHIEVDPDVRVGPFYFGHGPLQRHRLLDVELSREGVMRENRRARQK